MPSPFSLFLPTAAVLMALALASAPAIYAQGTASKPTASSGANSGPKTAKQKALEAEEQAEKALTARLHSATVMLDRRYGKFAVLLKKINESSKINIICDHGIDPDRNSYSVRSDGVLAADVALAQATQSMGMAFEPYSGVIFVRLQNAKLARRPPAIDMGLASDAAKKLLTETVSVSLDDVPLSEAIQTLSDATGYEIRFPTKEEEEEGYSKPDPKLRVTLELSEFKVRAVLRIFMRMLRLGATVRGNKLMLWSFRLESSSKVFETITKALSADSKLEIKAGTMKDLAEQIRKEYKFGVFLDPGIAEKAVKAPPKGLSLQATLYLAPGIHSGIGHRVVGDALVFENRVGRRRPPSVPDFTKANTDLLVALQMRRLKFKGEGRTLKAVCESIDKRYGTIRILCDKELGDKEVRFSAQGIRLGALLEHVARVTNARILCNDNELHFKVN